LVSNKVIRKVASVCFLSINGGRSFTGSQWLTAGLELKPRMVGTTLAATSNPAL